MLSRMLEPFILANVFGMLLVFCRIGAALFLLPGLGELFIPGRIRLSIALAFTVVLFPVLQPTLPAAPTNPLALAVLIAGETCVGVFFGMLARMLTSALHVAGTIVGMQSSLASAVMFDLTQESQGTSITTFYAMFGVVLLFAADLHHMMLSALADSYTLFVPGKMPPIGDIAMHAARTMGQVFMLGFNFSAPVMLVTFLMYLGAGVLSRLMPTMPVFFVIIPVQVLVSFLVMAATFSASMLWYLGHFDETIFGFIAD